MATMRVKVQKRSVGFGTEKKDIYVSRVDRNTIYDIDDIAHQVSLESGVNKRQFKAAVEVLVDAMKVFLKGGAGVSLQDFGTFLPEVKSDSSENPEEVGVKRIRVSFRPHKNLWKTLGEMSYNTNNEFTASAAEGGDSPTPDTNGSQGGGNDNGGGTEFD